MRRTRIRQWLSRPAGWFAIPAVITLVSAVPAWAEPPANGSNATVLETRLRRPVGLAITVDGRWLFVANRRSGTVSIVDTERQAVVGEETVGRTLADLARLPDGRLLAVDEAEAQLVLLAGQAPELRVVDRLPVAAVPVSVGVSPDGSRAAVASLWPRRVTLVELPDPAGAEDGATWRITHAVALPFAPRKLLFVGDGEKLVVADAFGGSLALVDATTGEILSTRQFPAHNIRGLNVGHDRGQAVLLLTHQVLNPLARTDMADIHWGTLITNNLRRLQVDTVLSGQEDLLAGSRLDFLGDVGRAAGDPAGITALADGRVAVALAGIDEVVVGLSDSPQFDRVAVGRRPTELLASPDGRHIYVANTLDDSISTIETQDPSTAVEISLGPQPDLEAADRGERLFYDARLSHDGWMSCHSCHTDGHTNGQLNDNFSDGSFDTPKRVLSLLGVADTAPFAWNGGMPDLKTQIRASVGSTMRGTALADDQVGDLEAFLRSLPPVAAGARAVGADREAPHDLVRRGGEIFARRQCDRCHTPPFYTSAGTRDVDLADEAGHVDFNPPSLRGVADRERLFHDNRAGDLGEVFTRYRHQLKTEMDDELRALLAFLRSL